MLCTCTRSYLSRCPSWSPAGDPGAGQNVPPSRENRDPERLRRDQAPDGAAEPGLRGHRLPSLPREPLSRTGDSARLFGNPWASGTCWLFTFPADALLLAPRGFISGAKFHTQGHQLPDVIQRARGLGCPNNSHEYRVSLRPQSSPEGPRGRQRVEALLELKHGGSDLVSSVGSPGPLLSLPTWGRLRAGSGLRKVSSGRGQTGTRPGRTAQLLASRLSCTTPGVTSALRFSRVKAGRARAFCKGWSE